MQLMLACGMQPEECRAELEAARATLHHKEVRDTAGVMWCCVVLYGVVCMAGAGPGAAGDTPGTGRGAHQTAPHTRALASQPRSYGNGFSSTVDCKMIRNIG